MHARDSGIFLPGPFRRLFDGGGGARGQGGRLHLVLQKFGGRHSFEKQRFDGANPNVAMEAALHRLGVQSVVKRQQAHGLMMSHVGVNRYALFAVPGTFPGEIDGLVEAHGTVQIHGLQAPEVLDGVLRLDRQGEHGGVGRYHQVVFESRFQSQRWNAEGAVLIDLMVVEGTIGRLGDAPGNVPFAPILDLQADRFTAGSIQQRVGEGSREHQRHQVLEHGAAPGKQRRPAGGRHQRAAQREPVLGRHVALGDRNQTGEPAFTGQEIVMAVEFERTADRIPDPEQAAIGVIKKPHVNAGREFGCGKRQFLHPLHGFECSVAGRLILTVQLIEPRRQFRPQPGPSAPGENSVHRGRAAHRESEQRGSLEERGAPQLYGIFAALAQEGIGRMSQRLDPRQVAIDDFSPGVQFAANSGDPVSALVPGLLPVAHALQLLDGVERLPQAADEQMALRTPAPQLS